MNISQPCERMEELFALKRQERPPENFLRDFIREFHRRHGLAESPRRKSASGRKDAGIV